MKTQWYKTKKVKKIKIKKKIKKIKIIKIHKHNKILWMIQKMNSGIKNKNSKIILT